MYAPFDSHRKVARLPGPPYHFISRVREVDGQMMGAMKEGAEVVVEYDVPKDAWYFAGNGAPVMPYAVLLEAGLQPCGWLASYIGCALTKEHDICFRNLDGTSVQHLEITPHTGILQTHVRLKTLAQAGGNIIVAFDVEMTTLDGTPVFTMDTVFGFFPPQALAAQAGLPVTDALRAMLQQDSGFSVDLRTQPPAFFGPTLRLADQKLLMIDELTGWWPDQGEAGLGVMRAIKHIDPAQWFFKAHFFQDPVQPGSLGLEAMVQVLQAAMIQKNLHQGIDSPRFEAIALSEDFTWKYRGQVLTHNTRVTTTVEITQVKHEDHGVLALASGSLWVDGMRIYQGTTFGMRIVSGGATKERTAISSASSAPETMAEGEDPDPAGPQKQSPHGHQEGQTSQRTFVVSLETDPWLRDHRPTYTAPALPMMSVLDLMAHAALEAAGEGWRLAKIERLALGKWLMVGEGQEVRLRTQAVPQGIRGCWEVTVSVWWEAKRAEFSRFDPVATCTVWLSDGAWGQADVPHIELGPTTLEPGNRYERGALFHGPSLQVLGSVERAEGGAIGQMNLSGASRGARPRRVAGAA